MNDPQALLRSAAMLESAGRLAEAEAIYQRVLAAWNRDSKRSVGPAAAYDRHQHERFIDDVIAAFEPGPTRSILRTSATTTCSTGG